MAGYIGISKGPFRLASPRWQPPPGDGVVAMVRMLWLWRALPLGGPRKAGRPADDGRAGYGGTHCDGRWRWADLLRDPSRVDEPTQLLPVVRPLMTPAAEWRSGRHRPGWPTVHRDIDRRDGGS